MFKSFKYRIYPDKLQSEQINKTIGVCRLLYNIALEIKIYSYKAHGVLLYSKDISKDLKHVRASYKWVKEVCSQASAQSIKNVDTAFLNFFNGKGYPKYKSKRDSNSFQIPSGLRKVDWDKSTLTIPKIKNIPISLSRKFDGKIKTVTISKTSTGKYFASILVETDEKELNPPIKSKALGIDLGINTFATLSNGEKIANPRHLWSSLKRLKVLQRRASRKRKGSNNRKKANLKLALLHEKIANKRKDFLHKLSTKLISDNQTDTICIEDLSVKNMVKNHNLAQAISDVSWSEFVRQLEYKGKWYGKNIVKINRFYASSKTCSNCGHKKNELNLSERTWNCSKCNVTHDRDINAAINIRNLGMGSPGEPVELRTKVRAKKQELYT